jgi:hypothetical protein
MLACYELLKACGLIEVVVDEVHLEAPNYNSGSIKGGATFPLVSAHCRKCY